MERDVREKFEEERSEKQPVDLTTRMIFKELPQCVIEGGWSQTENGKEVNERCESRQLFGYIYEEERDEEKGS